MAERLLIVGAGMAAAYLLQELSRLHHQYHITVVGDERDACYNRVLLSGVLAGESDEDDLPLLTQNGAGHAVRFITGTRIVSVDTQCRNALTNSGDSLPYDTLVFATGATVARPEMAAAPTEGIRELRTLDDARHLRSLDATGRRAIVVGGGLLGLEAAHGLHGLGFDTTVIHRQRYLMNRQLDEEGGHHLRRTMEHSGIHFVLETSVSALHARENRVAAVTLAQGQRLPCDLVVFATGIEPNATLARTVGIACGRGILVDDRMQTSDPHCYALGECSQMGERCFGLVAPIRAQAVGLAAHLMGVSAPAMAFEDWPVQLKISGVEIFSAGSVHAGGDQLLLRDHSADTYRRLLLQGNRLVGAVLVGDKREGAWYAQLIRDGADISGYRSGLMFGKAVSQAMQLSAVAA
jgi:nitrite reductase (NADH) large subunit